MYDVITIGAGALDVFLRSKEFEVIKSKKSKTGFAECFSFGGKTEVSEMGIDTGGGGTNAAVTFARAGKKTAWIGNLGKDLFGDYVLKNLKTEKVDCLVKRSNIQTGYSNILLSKSGQRTILGFRGASDDWVYSEIPWGKIRAKWFYITSLGGNLDLLERLLDFAEEHAINVAINPGAQELKAGWEALVPLLERVHILVLNREEAAGFTKKTLSNTKGIITKLFDVAQQVVIMTDGERGAYAYDGGFIYRVDAIKKRVVDTTGAGDAFGSGFVYEFMKKQNVERAMKYAIWNSGSVVTKIGAKEGIVRSFPNQPIRVKVKAVK